MGLRFGDLTPEEFSQIVAGYLKREEREWYRSAWMASRIMAPHLKRKVTPEKLLGWSRASPLGKATRMPEEE